MNWETFEKRVLLGRTKEREKGAEQRKIEEGVFDEFTAEAVYRLAVRGEVDVLHYCISTGKEANVFRARGKEGDLRALKIYRIDTSDFRNMRIYVDGDRRFENVKKDKRSIVLAWCRKEFSNLMLATEAGVRVPEPYDFYRNVLVMKFIGNERAAAPTLHEVRNEMKNAERLFWDILEDVGKLYANNLVHADLSEYNILAYRNKHCFIDMGQGVLKSHPMAETFLERDVTRIANFFREKGNVKTDVKTAVEMVRTG